MIGNLTGAYGRWTVVQPVQSKGRHPRYLCRCQCGTQRVVYGYNLRTGQSRSCGCLRDELCAARFRGTTGEASPRWVGDNASYAAVHRRLRLTRGWASALRCLDCGEPAAEWSYTRAGGPAERTRSDGIRYSVNLADYVPRCISCHRIRDWRGKAA